MSAYCLHYNNLIHFNDKDDNCSNIEQKQLCYIAICCSFFSLVILLKFQLFGWLVLPDPSQGTGNEETPRRPNSRITLQVMDQRSSSSFACALSGLQNQSYFQEINCKTTDHCVTYYLATPQTIVFINLWRAISPWKSL